MACLTLFLLVGQAGAADQAEQAEAGNKAGVLEEKASATGGKTRPAPAETI